MSKIEFITTPYEIAHGKSPKGRGSWAFSIDKNASYEDVFFTRSMTYSEAKKVVMKHFEGKTDTLFVLS